MLGNAGLYTHQYLDEAGRGLRVDSDLQSVAVGVGGAEDASIAEGGRDVATSSVVGRNDANATDERGSLYRKGGRHGNESEDLDVRDGVDAVVSYSDEGL